MFKDKTFIVKFLKRKKEILFFSSLALIIFIFIMSILSFLITEELENIPVGFSTVRFYDQNYLEEVGFVAFVNKLIEQRGITLRSSGIDPSDPILRIIRDTDKLVYAFITFFVLAFLVGSVQFSASFLYFKNFKKLENKEQFLTFEASLFLIVVIYIFALLAISLVSILIMAFSTIWLCLFSAKWFSLYQDL